MRGTFEEPPTGLITWLSKLREILTLHFAASPSLLQGKPTQAQDVARRISGAVAGEVFAQVKTYQVPITNTSPSHLHYLPFASRFPLPHFTLAVLFALSFPISYSLFRSLSSALLLFAAMSKIGEIIVNMDNNDNMANSEAPSDEPLSCILKGFELVVVILSEKGLFKISLLVSVLYLPWVILFFIELLVLRMLSLCL